MRMKPLAVVACAALAVTAFTACGDDDDTPTVTTPELGTTIDSALDNLGTTMDSAMDNLGTTMDSTMGTTMDSTMTS